MIAKRKKFIITGVIILAMIAIICIVIAYNIDDETDYVFEGTFVKAEETIDLEDATANNFEEQENLEEINKQDCFKRKSGDRIFV